MLEVLLEEPPAPEAPRAPAPKRPSRSIRFDATSPDFERLSEALRRAVDRADRLWRRVQDAEEAGDHAYAKQIAWKLARAEAELDEARAALTRHVERTGLMVGKRRRRARRNEPVKVARVA